MYLSVYLLAINLIVIEEIGGSVHALLASFNHFEADHMYLAVCLDLCLFAFHPEFNLQMIRNFNR